MSEVAIIAERKFAINNGLTVVLATWLKDFISFLEGRGFNVTEPVVQSDLVIKQVNVKGSWIGIYRNMGLKHHLIIDRRLAPIYREFMRLYRQRRAEVVVAA